VRTCSSAPECIAALSYFGMLCDCWLGIPPDTSVLCYFYSLTRYEHKVFSRIWLNLCRNRRKEYLSVTFKGCWKDSSRWWFLIDLGDMPQWLNKHLLLPLIVDKRNAPEDSPQLQALVKRVPELHRARLEACHYAKGFIPWWIRSLDRWEKWAFECL
jgi:hypothetical protein